MVQGRLDIDHEMRRRERDCDHKEKQERKRKREMKKEVKKEVKEEVKKEEGELCFVQLIVEIFLIKLLKLILLH
jgi:hypothetical protein